MSVDAKTLAKYPLPVILLIALGAIGYMYKADKEAAKIREEKLEIKLEKCSGEYLGLFKECNE